MNPWLINRTACYGKGHADKRGGSLVLPPPRQMDMNLFKSNRMSDMDLRELFVVLRECQAQSQVIE